MKLQTHYKTYIYQSEQVCTELTIKFDFKVEQIDGYINKIEYLQRPTFNRSSNIRNTL